MDDYSELRYAMTKEERERLKAYTMYKVNGLNWTSELPTEPGWYWARTDAGESCVAEVGVFGTGRSKTLWVYITGSLKAHDLDVFDYYLGPLPVPEPPNG